MATQSIRVTTPRRLPVREASDRRSSGREAARPAPRFASSTTFLAPALAPLRTRPRPATLASVSSPPPLDSAPALSLRALSKSYESFRAVDAVDLDVHRGELFALLGINGAGKTTTIKMLMGILRPSRGTARILGLDCFAERAEVMRHVGYLPDEPTFYDHLRGREIIRFVGEMHGLSRATIQARAGALLERLELADASEEFAVNYSKGMRKKLALLLALLHEPDLLILDEPTNGLDPYATRALHALLREQAAAGRTIVFSTHLLDQAERLCDRVGILHRGRLAALGSVATLAAESGRDGSLEAIFFRVTGADSVRPEAPPGASVASITSGPPVVPIAPIAPIAPVDARDSVDPRR